jgi:hypothetical protein
MIEDIFQALARWSLLVLLHRAEKAVDQPFTYCASLRIDQLKLVNEMLRSTDGKLKPTKQAEEKAPSNEARRLSPRN